MRGRGLRGSTEKRRRIAEVIAASHGKSFCDDCARDAAHVTRIYASEAVMSQLALEMGFLREKSVCTQCGVTRMTTTVSKA